MDVIPLDASLIKGSHGRLVKDTSFHPVLITGSGNNGAIEATEVYNVIWQHLNASS
jgi:hypothetical protein